MRRDPTHCHGLCDIGHSCGHILVAGSRAQANGYNVARVYPGAMRVLKVLGQRVDEEERMEQANVSIELSIKIVDSKHYEFTTPCAPVRPKLAGSKDKDQHRPAIVQGTSSFIGPGLSVPAA